MGKAFRRKKIKPVALFKSEFKEKIKQPAKKVRVTKEFAEGLKRIQTSESWKPVEMKSLKAKPKKLRM